MNCPNCGYSEPFPINLQGTVLECPKCANRFHIAGLTQIELEYILDSSSSQSVGFAVTNTNQQERDDA